MSKSFISLMLCAVLVVVVFPAAATAGPDLFSGDTRIYGGSPVVLQPNVLIIIDDSGSMADTVPGGGSVYSNATTYTPVFDCTNSSGVDGSSCDTNSVYDVNYTYRASPVANLPTCTYSVAAQNDTVVNYASVLQQFGTISSGALNFSNGVATCCYQNITITTGHGHSATTNTYHNGECPSATYDVGNYINWIYDGSNQNIAKIEIAKAVISSLVQSTTGVRFGLMTYYYPGGGSIGAGGTFLNAVPPGFATSYTSTVKDMSTIFSGTYTNRQALSDTIQTLTPQGDTPLGEALFEALEYFEGGTPQFGATIGVTSATGGTGTNYHSPIQYGCQKNYVILITDGMSNEDTSAAMNLIKTTYGSWDGGFCSGYGTPAYTTCNGSDENHSLAGVAKYLYEHDLRSTISGTQNVTTFTVGFGTVGANTEAYDLLRLAADKNHGRGAYYAATSAQGLAKAFTNIMGEIFNVNTSFVAPVVPVSPENKTYAGSRVYMGFFQPETQAAWYGNLKKFKLGVYTSPTGTILDSSAVYDSTGNLATYVDNNGDGYDDRDGAKLPVGVQNGQFRSTAVSYWSIAADGGTVQAGGVGAQLMSRNYSISCPTCAVTGSSPRNIYTFLGTNTDLTKPINAFSTVNSALTPTTLGLPGAIISSGTTTDVNTLINYVQGFDTYDDNVNGNYTEKKQWTLGDILHSKPLIISYAVYDYVSVPANETNCSVNKTIIYTGANDGMLHAFNDCDGSEAWAFIPPDILPYLQYLRGNAHPYFVDGSVTQYIYQTNPQETSISAAAGDKVILVVGLRRGGGSDSEPGTGYYYALDVTTPTAPKFLWSISNTTTWIGTTKTSTTTFGDLGETWSDPKIVKIKVGSTDTIAVFIGGGYDNCNEDARFGAIQTFSGACVGAVTTADSGLDSNGNPLTSSGSTAVTTFTTAQYKGRAIYAVQLATLSAGVPNLAGGGTKIWGHTIADTTPFVYSIPSDMTAIDSNYDGYVDRIYAGDTGGNLWRINTLDTNTANWTVTKLFSSNPGYTGDPGAGVASAADGSTGRKIFYQPSVSIDANNLIWIFFGTGDREHPLNLAVTDRFYAVIDKGQSTTATEASLLDVSSDLIQNGTQAQVTTMQSLLNQAATPSNTTYYGWYMRLYGAEYNNTTPYQGEKVLAQPTLINGVVYFTTYAPSTSTTSTDPCQTGNLGTARLYALDYATGAAALNLDTTNDTLIPQWSTNPAAFDPTGKVLQRTDRTVNLGSGIPSSVQPSGLIGCGGGLCKQSLAPGGLVLPLYWRQR
jgi:type IV pilus assembly protein PilY1